MMSLSAANEAWHLHIGVVSGCHVDGSPRTTRLSKHIGPTLQESPIKNHQRFVFETASQTVFAHRS
ncbi:hypothetical protein VFPFJ_08630 [Purpureocillium lilacinum]|uniref:Uncharacterized protein n=1 Tax=Purpureocillium lilacinum TaxID=33203 RepID=A0A179GXZ0_PURLI|nr:hypothetical protein VFPFJ_08630 [Purpureocillium lilacinum]OAQ82827.1 hypothetical protein VFPFJ_08630 [Purpureocillium lilacinum]